jgi:hypothetical protein
VLIGLIIGSVIAIASCFLIFTAEGISRVKKRRRRYDENPAFRQLVDTIIATVENENAAHEEIRQAFLKEDKITPTEFQEAMILARTFMLERRSSPPS